jgi:hypothetical protein
MPFRVARATEGEGLDHGNWDHLGYGFREPPWK